ncbi:MAG: UbiD family decarboxylase [Dehalococcoidia bacterium]|nr:UbiD family decarboxylase [Dehalococcoidia bacterium]
MAQDFRQFVEALEKCGELIRIHSEVDPHNFEVSALMRHEEDGPNRAMLFEKLKGYQMAVVAHPYASIKRLAIALGIEPTSEDVERYRRDPAGSAGGWAGCTVDAYTWTDEERAMAIMVKDTILRADEEASRGKYIPQIVASGTCQEVVITKDIDVRATLPTPWLCEKDAAPFITPGVLVKRDPDTGILDIGIHRNQVAYKNYGKDKIGVLLSDHSDGFRIQQKYEARGERCEVALCLGPEPSVQIMAAYTSPHLLLSPAYSEFAGAGALVGEPVKMVKCKTVDLEAPASTEIVVEGYIPANERIEEGPMAEYPDYYSQTGPLTFIQVTAITHRLDPLYHALMSGGSREHLTLGGITSIGFAQNVLVKVRRLFPTVKDVAFAGGSRLSHLVVSLKKRYEGEERSLLHYLVGTSYHRYITIVDDDIDPHDDEMVEWARNTRAGHNADDFVIFPRSRTHNLDPEQDKDRLGTKLGILATVPFGEKYERSGPPQSMLEQTRALYEREARP